MKVLAVFVAFCLIAVKAQQQLESQDYCYKDVAQACKATSSKIAPSALIKDCTARYGGIDEVIGDLQAYANTHISRSFEYLLMSTHYANYEKNRPGFEKLFKDLSDSKWEEAIELIKYITKRGGRMNFSERKKDLVNNEQGNYELYELESMAKALDMEKHLANEAHSIHGAATRRRKEWHDPEVSSYLEEEFVHKLSKNIRQLSGYTSDLRGLLSTKDSSLALYLFDNYLQKTL